ncbi:MAG: hypothetical protein V4609_09470 [Pseudomonadota bacterium]
MALSPAPKARPARTTKASNAAKAPAKAAVKARARAPVKPPVKAAAKPPVRTPPAAPIVSASPAALPPRPPAFAKPGKPDKSDKDEKAKKPKMVRDSFTIPKAEYVALEALKQRAATAGTGVKKSELLRAGIKALVAMDDKQFAAAIAAVPAIKTGRPAKD